MELARLGCVVFLYDMIGDADSVQLPESLAHDFTKQRSEMNTTENWGLFSPQAEAHLYAGIFWNYDFSNQNKSGPLGISVLNFKDGQWRSLKVADDLLPGVVTTLTLAGNDLWVGGLGYIALIDPVQDKMLHFAYVRAPTVDRI